MGRREDLALRKEANDILRRAASIDATGVDVRQGAATAFEQSYEAAALRHAVALERGRVEHSSSGQERNAPQDHRPTWREWESARRWGPAPQIPTTPPPAQLRRQQIEIAILDINRELGSRHLMDKDLIAKRDQLVRQLNALPEIKQHTSEEVS